MLFRYTRLILLPPCKHAHFRALRWQKIVNGSPFCQLSLVPVLDYIIEVSVYLNIRPFSYTLRFLFSFFGFYPYKQYPLASFSLLNI